MLPAVESPDGDPEKDWDRVLKLLQRVPTLAEIPQLCDKALVQLAAMQDRGSPTASKLTKALEQSASASSDMLSRFSRLARRCDEIIEEMDFSFLFDVERKLFTIGYNVTASRADDSYYDLLASEARLASFVGIAKGDVPQQHWFRMGRALTKVDHGRALISWTGTMFEYLMPLLVMRNYPNTLLSETYETIVERQIEYGEERGVPWGISEAAYNVRDLHLNYQYGPFGVPGLGLKRGLIEDLVVAPYSTMLAAEVNPDAAMKNLRRLQKEGALGPYGYYESIDYTAERLPEGQNICADSGLHDSPSGYEPRFTCERVAGRSRGETFSRRPRCPGDRVAPPGTNSGWRTGCSSTSGRSLDRTRSPNDAGNDHGARTKPPTSKPHARSCSRTALTT